MPILDPSRTIRFHAVVIYCRVSTRGQTGSLPRQEGEARRYAAERGWTVAAVLQEVASGRGLTDRPELEKARRAAVQSDAAILVTERDRLIRGRSPCSVASDTPHPDDMAEIESWPCPVVVIAGWDTRPGENHSRPTRRGMASPTAKQPGRPRIGERKRDRERRECREAKGRDRQARLSDAVRLRRLGWSIGAIQRETRLRRGDIIAKCRGVTPGADERTPDEHPP